MFTFGVGCKSVVCMLDWLTIYHWEVLRISAVYTYDTFAHSKFLKVGEA